MYSATIDAFAGLSATMLHGHRPLHRPDEHLRLRKENSSTSFPLQPATSTAAASLNLQLVVVVTTLLVLVGAQPFALLLVLVGQKQRHRQLVIAVTPPAVLIEVFWSVGALDRSSRGTALSSFQGISFFFEANSTRLSSSLGTSFGGFLFLGFLSFLSFLSTVRI